MADEKGSDLDVFEGLTKKKKSTLGPSDSALPGASQAPGAGSAPPPANSLPAAKLPPPKKTLMGFAASTEAGAKTDAAPRVVTSAPKPSADLDDELAPEATAEMRRPTKQEIERLMKGDDEGAEAAPVPEARPSLEVVADSEPPSDESSAPPAEVSAIALDDDEEGLDWDDENESTSVFGKKHAAELFGDFGERPTTPQAEPASPERKAAAALLAGSSKSVTISPAAGLSAGSFESLPKIPAPAPVPREIAVAQSFESAPAPAATNAPAGWGPSVPPATEPRGRRQSNVWLGIVAVAVLLVGAYVWQKMSGPGTLVVRVEHRGQAVDTAQVFVDGQQVCTFTPCRVKNVDQGKRSVRVASGPLAAQGSIVVKGGFGETELTLQLGVSTDESAPPSPTAPYPTEAPTATTPLKLAALVMKTAISEKVKVTVDGQDKGTLPLELKDLKPGTVTVRFEPEGDKYGTLEKTFVLESGKTFVVEDLKLPVKVVTVTFKVETRGALVRLEEQGKAPVTLPIVGASVERKLDTSSKWKVLASLRGYRDLEQAIVFEADSPTLSVVIKLDKEDEPAASAPPPTSTDNKAPTSPPPTSAAPPASEGGTLSANSIPPSSVLIDGRPHGQTPVTGVKVSAGSHSVLFKHKDYGVQSRTVTVQPGKSASVAVRFDTKKK